MVIYNNCKREQMFGTNVRGGAVCGRGRVYMHNGYDITALNLTANKK